jgi:hypothetical protein
VAREKAADIKAFSAPWVIFRRFSENLTDMPP